MDPLTLLIIAPPILIALTFHEFILFHIEVQGYVHTNFNERMFGYYIRILSFKFNVFDLRDVDYQKCIESNNPVKVAVSILAPTTEIPAWKKKADAIKRLVKLQLTPKEIHLLVGFVDRLVPLKARELEKFAEYAYEEQEVKMVITSFEEKALIKGREEGREEGWKVGKDEGREEGWKVGKEEGKIDDLLKILRIKFGDIPSWMLAKIESLKDIEKIDQLIEQAALVDDIDKFLANTKL